jgi:hypothetical protein
MAVVIRKIPGIVLDKKASGIVIPDNISEYLEIRL